MTSLEARRKAGRLALGFFAIGVALAAGIILPFAWPISANTLRWYLPPVGCGLVAGALTAWGLGQAAAVAPWRGLVVAWSALVMAVLGGSLGTYFLPDAHEAFADWLHDFVFKPMFWFVLVGMLPALVLGAIYAWVLRRALKAEGGSASPNTVRPP